LLENKLEILLTDSSWGIRYDAVKSLGKLTTANALRFLRAREDLEQDELIKAQIKRSLGSKS
jgi:hypothetical protein